MFCCYAGWPTSVCKIIQRLQLHISISAFCSTRVCISAIVRQRSYVFPTNIYIERDRERYGHPDFSFDCVSHCGATRLGWRRGCAGSSHMYKHIYMYTDIHILYINIYTISNTTNKTHCFFFTRAPAREGEAVVAITYIYIYIHICIHTQTQPTKQCYFCSRALPRGGEVGWGEGLTRGRDQKIWSKGAEGPTLLHNERIGRKLKTASSKGSSLAVLALLSSD